MQNIYRYRQCNDYSLDALIRNHFYLSVPEKFNDPYDVVYSFNEIEIKAYIINEMNEETRKKIDEMFLESGVLGNTAEEIINNLVVGHFLSIVRRNTLVGCLSKQCDDEVMWAHYSDSGTGFVLEYDIDNLKHAVNERVSLIKTKYMEYASLNPELFSNIDETMEQSFNYFGVKKVNYANYKPDSTEMIKELVDYMLKSFEIPTPTQEDVRKIIKFEVNFPIKMFKEILKDSKIKQKITTNLYAVEQLDLLLTKKEKWSYEDEVRVILPNIGSNFEIGKFDYYKFDNIFPTAIIMGEFMSTRDRFTCARVAMERNIPLKQMKTNYSNNPPILEVEDVEFNIYDEYSNNED